MTRDFVCMRVQFHDTTLPGTAPVDACGRQHSGECVAVASASVVRLVIASRPHAHVPAGEDEVVGVVNVVHSVFRDLK